MDFRKGIKQVEIEGEKVDLKRGWMGWRIVEPLKDETGKFIWKNFISKKGLISLGFILLLLLLGWLTFKEQIANYHQVMNNPCAYCSDCQSHTLSVLNNYSRQINTGLRLP